MGIIKNRWIVLFAGLIIQIILGGLYAWSSFTPYLIKDYGFSKTESGLIFGTMIISFTIFMIPAGRLLNHSTPSVVSGIGALLYSSGFIISSFSKGNYPIVFISIGVLSGAGIGFGYVCPLSVIIKWFPKYRGLVTGIAAAGFGSGAILLSSISGIILKNLDIFLFFKYYGFTTGIILLSASSLLSTPLYKKPINVEHIKTYRFNTTFYLLSFGLFIGTFSGLNIIGNLSLIIQDAGLSLKKGIIAISLFSVWNTIGRISWGILYDKFKSTTIPISQLTLALSCLLFLFSYSTVILYISVSLLGFSFGANFVIYAGNIADSYGSKNFPKIYPICFLAYGFAGLLGPAFGGFFSEKTGSYNPSLIISSILLLASAMIINNYIHILNSNNH